MNTVAEAKAITTSKSLSLHLYSKSRVFGIPLHPLNAAAAPFNVYSINFYTHISYTYIYILNAYEFFSLLFDFVHTSSPCLLRISNSCCFVEYNVFLWLCVCVRSMNGIEWGHWKIFLRLIFYAGRCTIVLCMYQQNCLASNTFSALVLWHTAVSCAETRLHFFWQLAWNVQQNTTMISYDNSYANGSSILDWILPHEQHIFILILLFENRSQQKKTKLCIY